MSELNVGIQESAPFIHDFNRRARLLGMACLASAAAVGVSTFETPLAVAQSPQDAPISSTANASSIYTPPSGELKGILMILPGGGWQPFRGDVLNHPYMRAQEKIAGSVGFGSLRATYRGGQAGWIDVLARYKEAKDLADGRPVCAAAASAGAQLALMLATKRNIACVIGEAAPTNLPNLDDQASEHPALYGALTKLAAAQAFAPGVTDPSAINQALWRWSPLRLAHKLSSKTRILLGHAENDPLVSSDQTRAFDGFPNIDTVVLGPGSADFIHVPLRPGEPGVDPEQLDEFTAKKRTLLRSVARQAATKILAARKPSKKRE